MKKLLDIAAGIIHAQASVGHMSPEQIEQSLIKTFSTLQRMQKAEEKGVFLDSCAAEEMDMEEAGAVRKEPRESIQDDKIICLECGMQMRQLTTKHLRVHNLTPREYKQKWGFSQKQPLSARSLTKARSKAAKQRGLPENLVKFLEEKKQRKVEAAALVETDTEQMEGKPTVKRRRKAHYSA
jgi:predicted transcriptional regulator